MSEFLQTERHAPYSGSRSEGTETPEGLRPGAGVTLGILLSSLFWLALFDLWLLA